MLVIVDINKFLAANLPAQHGPVFARPQAGAGRGGRNRTEPLSVYCLNFYTMELK